MTETIRHLMRLGLSEYEARAYVATVALGEGTVKEISQESRVHRSRTYDIMERLAKKGFVEMGNTSPICYRAHDPAIASKRLMEDITRANEKILKELQDIGNKAERRDNPIWTLTGAWAIEHKLEDLMDAARREVSVVFFSRRSLLQYAKLIARISESKDVTVVLSHQPESFAGLLGNSRVMRLRPIAGFITEMEGMLCDRGFVTNDGQYCIEMIMLADKETTLILTREGEGHRAIIITGTVLNIFGHDTVEKLVQSAEEVHVRPLDE